MEDNKILKLESKYGSLLVRMALSNMFDKGMEFCRYIEDKEIEELEGNAMMTKAFVQDIVRISRELSTYSLWEDIIPYIKDYVEIGGAVNYKDKTNRYKTIAYNAITLGQLDEQYRTKDDLCCDLGCDEEEFDEIMEGMSAFDIEE